MKLEKKWHDLVPNNDWNGAVHFLNELAWNLTWREANNNWLLFSGDQRIVSFETRVELEAFVLGMALGIAVLPDEILNQIKKLIED